MGRLTNQFYDLARRDAEKRLHELHDEMQVIQKFLLAHKLTAARTRRPRNPKVVTTTTRATMAKKDNKSFYQSPKFRETMRKAAIRGWKNRRLREQMAQTGGAVPPLPS